MAAVETEKEMVVLYPSPGMGHLVSMFELGKLLVRHGLAVTIIIVEPHYNTGSTATFIADVSAANPFISFHRLPTFVPPPSPSPHPEARAFDVLRHSNSNLFNFLRDIPHRLLALVIDFFCCYAFEVAAALNLPCYLFWTSGAAVCASFFYLPVLHAKTNKSFGEMGKTPLEIPGLPPLKADHMPLPLLDRDDEAYKGFLYFSKRQPDACGIIINTIASLEPRAIEAITAGDCTPKGKGTPPVYCIGPIIKPSEQNSSCGVAECLQWLDKQPKDSVVFLCFGSVGVFSAAQLKEIAIGLERSGQRFLWVVRSAPSDAKLFEKPPEPDFDILLPEGFLERTKECGMVVKSWAPQTAVLSHVATGGFVTHCGWNSVLEAVCAGVPMIAWPLYAEQRMNKVFLVEEMKLAVEMIGYDKGLVTADEVEAKVRWLMESNGGKELKRRAETAKDDAAAALKEGGASHAAMLQVVARIKHGQ